MEIIGYGCEALGLGTSGKIPEAIIIFLMA